MIVRTYEKFSVRFEDRGSTWSGYHTAEEAAAHAGSDGVVVRETFEVAIPEDRVWLYKGRHIAERTVIA